MTNQLLKVAAVGLLAGLTLLTSAHAQDAKSIGKIYNGQITKIDARVKTITIKGPREGLIPDSGATGRGAGAGGGRSGGRGRGGGSSGAGGGGDMRSLESVETKIVWTLETTCESLDGPLSLADLKDGDYVVVNTRKNGRKVEAVSIKRTTAAAGGGLS